MSLVTDYLSKRGAEFERLPHAPAVTSLDEAETLGLTPCDVAKTLILDRRGGHVVVVLCADRRLDLAKVRRLLADPHVRLSTEAEIRRDYPNFELGALPALGSLLSAPMIVDEQLTARAEVVFADGLRTESVRMRTVDLLESEHAVVADVSAG